MGSVQRCRVAGQLDSNWLSTQSHYFPLHDAARDLLNVRIRPGSQNKQNTSSYISHSEPVDACRKNGYKRHNFSTITALKAPENRRTRDFCRYQTHPQDWQRSNFIENCGCKQRSTIPSCILVFKRPTSAGQLGIVACCRIGQQVRFTIDGRVSPAPGIQTHTYKTHWLHVDRSNRDGEIIGRSWSTASVAKCGRFSRGDFEEYCGTLRSSFCCYRF